MRRALCLLVLAGLVACHRDPKVAPPLPPYARPLACDEACQLIADHNAMSLYRRLEDKDLPEVILTDHEVLAPLPLGEILRYFDEAAAAGGWRLVRDLGSEPSTSVMSPAGRIWRQGGRTLVVLVETKPTQERPSPFYILQYGATP